MNPRYIPQLREVLTWPQSIGIVGGRPGSSLAFVGCQDEQVLFLDPHTPQQVWHPTKKHLFSCALQYIIMWVDRIGLDTHLLTSGVVDNSK